MRDFPVRATCDPLNGGSLVLTDTLNITDPESAYKAIDALRERRGMSKMDLADRAGIPQPNVVAYLNGRRGMDLSTMLRLATVLGATLTLTPTKNRSISEKATGSDRGFLRDKFSLHT